MSPTDSFALQCNQLSRMGPLSLTESRLLPRDPRQRRVLVVLSVHSRLTPFLILARKIYLEHLRLRAFCVCSD